MEEVLKKLKDELAGLKTERIQNAEDIKKCTEKAKRKELFDDQREINEDIKLIEVEITKLEEAIKVKASSTEGKVESTMKDEIKSVLVLGLSVNSAHDTGPEIDGVDEVVSELEVVFHKNAVQSPTLNDLVVKYEEYKRTKNGGKSCWEQFKNSLQGTSETNK